MNINWFPGHMSKSMRMIESDIKLVDAVIYVLDSRAPYSCLNPQFSIITQGKPIVYVLNKADLGDTVRVEEWVKALSVNKSIAVPVVGTVSGGAAAIVSAVKKLCGAKLEKYRNKGVNTAIRAMVLGVPNCGKSTIINCLCKSAKTVTGNRAGVTRGKQWVRVNDFLEVLDTPGTLYPKLTDQNVAMHLAFIGSIRDEVLDTHELAEALYREMSAYNSAALRARYNVDASDNDSDSLGSIALSRGLLLKGGVADTNRAAAVLLDDFRKGRLGKVTLERVKDYDVGVV